MYEADGLQILFTAIDTLSSGRYELVSTLAKHGQVKTPWTVDLYGGAEFDFPAYDVSVSFNNTESNTIHALWTVTEDYTNILLRVFGKTNEYIEIKSIALNAVIPEPLTYRDLIRQKISPLALMLKNHLDPLFVVYTGTLVFISLAIAHRKKTLKMFPEVYIPLIAITLFIALLLALSIFPWTSIVCLNQ